MYHRSETINMNILVNTTLMGRKGRTSLKTSYWSGFMCVNRLPVGISFFIQMEMSQYFVELNAL